MLNRKAKRKAFGQHFLRDAGIAGSIAERAVTDAIERGCKALLEIGPGKGAITFPILKQIEMLPSGKTLPFSICEKDRELAAFWERESAVGPAKFQVFESDFLDLPETSWLTSQPIGIVSNLPYSSGTAIFQRLARHHAEIPVMVLMFQAEVAKRLRANASSKEWGSLSLWTQNRWDVEKFLFVPPRAFAPPPKVDSEVVVLYPRATPRIQGTETAEGDQKWESLLRVGFAHRRKMLRSSLPASGPWRNALETSGLDGTKRAESLSWEEWQKFFNALNP